MRVLGIETSCDETGVALYDGGPGGAGLLAHAVYSQIELHAEYGGVVPELASRDHIRKLLPLIEQVLEEAGMAAGDIEGVAYTAGPGLVGALLVGAALGRSLAWAWGVPAVAVHHMEGHLLAPLLEDPAPAFPFVALLVSGGHTQLVDVQAIGRYRRHVGGQNCGHEEVDVGQGVGQPDRLFDILQTRLTPFARAVIQDEQAVGPQAVIHLPELQGHGRLAIPVVHNDSLRRNRNGPLHQLRRNMEGSCFALANACFP